jgi:hypothetical protein
VLLSLLEPESSEVEERIDASLTCELCHSSVSCFCDAHHVTAAMFRLGEKDLMPTVSDNIVGILPFRMRLTAELQDQHRMAGVRLYAAKQRQRDAEARERQQRVRRSVRKEGLGRRRGGREGGV